MKKNFFSNLVNERGRGASIVLAVLILTILLAIALGLNSLIIEQTKIIRETGYSVKTFYVADSGIEEVLLTNTIPPGWVPFDGSFYKIYCECCDKDFKPNCSSSSPLCPTNCSPASIGSSCIAPNYCLKSIGSYQNIQGAIQIDY